MRNRVGDAENHPLARRKHIKPRDLLEFPLVNSPDSFGQTAITLALEKYGVFRGPPSRIQAFFGTTIRRYVQLGFGIGLMGRTPAQTPMTGLHEHSMSRYFGRHTFYFIRRKEAPQLEAAKAFVATMKALLGGTARSNRRRK